MKIIEKQAAAGGHVWHQRQPWHQWHNGESWREALAGISEIIIRGCIAVAYGSVVAIGGANQLSGSKARGENQHGGSGENKRGGWRKISAAISESEKRQQWLEENRNHHGGNGSGNQQRCGSVTCMKKRSIVEMAKNWRVARQRRAW